MFLRYVNQITECGNKASSWKVIVKWILSAWNDIPWETIWKSFKSCVLTTALDGDEDDHCFKPENPFVPILGDIAEATPIEMLIDEDEEGDEEIDVLLWCIIRDFFITKMLLKVTQFNKPPVSNSTPSRLIPRGKIDFVKQAPGGLFDHLRYCQLLAKLYEKHFL